MEEHTFPRAALATFLFTIPLVSGTWPLLSVVSDRLETSQDDQAFNLSLLMDVLDRYYTPECLRIIISTSDSSKLLNSSSAKGVRSISDNLFSEPASKYSMEVTDGNNMTETKAYMKLVLTSDTLRRIKYLFKYIGLNTERVLPFACVTYMLSRPPDYQLLSFLTDTSSSHKFTRYMLVQTQNTDEAERFLLDQRLRHVVNIAALVQEEAQNKSYWRVLIRQLLHPSGSPQVLTVNRWSRDTGLASTENIFPEQMANFYGAKMYGAAQDFVPFIETIRTKGSRKIQLKPSVDKFLLDVVAEKMNFTYEMNLPPDGEWGYLHKDGYFVGIVGEVQFGRANFSLSMSATFERIPYVDFTAIYHVDSISFIAAKSRPDPLWRKLLTPFRTSVWVCLIISVGVGALLYTLFNHVQTATFASSSSSSGVFMSILASFLSQSLHRYLGLQAARVFLGFWFLYAFLVTSYYKTSLTSTLAVPFPPSTINTLQELLQSGLSFGMQAAKGSEYSLFATSNASLYKQMFEKMKFHNEEESMEMVGDGTYSFITYRSHLEPLVAYHNHDPTRKSDITFATEEFFTGGYVWLIPKGVPYKSSIDAVMASCVRGGLVDKWIEDANAIYVKGQVEKKAREEEEEEGKAELVERELMKEEDSLTIAFSLDHLQGAFFILFLGNAGALVVLLLELLLAWNT